MNDQAAQNADDFLHIADRFRLGSLPTESRHPGTLDLAALSRSNLPEAYRILKDIDVGVIGEVAKRGGDLERLRTAIDEAMAGGNSVFFYGCGATGRLSLSIEYLWRGLHPGPRDGARVHGFMSGGDLALVHSIEKFEDYPEYGARQLRESGFGPNDLLICCTEGGETPSVIGAVEEAVRLSARKPFFLYCNPDSALRTIERSRLVLDNPAIEKICLDVGPMALSGSTRLQASTALMLSAAAALMNIGPAEIADFARRLQKTDLSFLAPFTEAEAGFCQAGDFMLYETANYAITVLTDTTERSPTFSLRSFENQNDPERLPSLSYLRLPQAGNATEAWEKVLLRPPATIEWPELKAVAGHKRILGFDFSAAALGQRETLTAPKTLHRFSIDRAGNAMQFRLGDLQHDLDVGGLHPLFEHLLLKMALNMHSTLVMGRLGRFESNIMTWVRPSNNKLIDRSIRYVDYLLQAENITLPYDDICRGLFREMEQLQPGEAIVMKTLKALRP